MELADNVHQIARFKTTTSRKHGLEDYLKDKEGILKKLKTSSQCSELIESIMKGSHQGEMNIFPYDMKGACSWYEPVDQYLPVCSAGANSKKLSSTAQRVKTKRLENKGEQNCGLFKHGSAHNTPESQRRRRESSSSTRVLVTIDDDSLEIRLVGKNTKLIQRYRVKTSALQAAGGAWNELVTRSFCSGKNQRIVFIPHNGESQTSLIILLNILHSRISELPQKLTFADLVELAILCNEYKCPRLVQPYLNKWINPWIPYTRTCGFERWLFIAWVFGYKSIFEDVTQHLAFLAVPRHIDSRVNRLRSFSYVPISLIVNVTRVQTELLKKTYEICGGIVDQLQRPFTLQTSLCKEAVSHTCSLKDKKACDASVAECLALHQPLYDFVDRPASMIFHSSITTIRGLMLAATTKAFRNDVHATCSPAQVFRLQFEEAELPSMLDQKLRQHFDRFRDPLLSDSSLSDEHVFLDDDFEMKDSFEGEEDGYRVSSDVGDLTSSEQDDEHPESSLARHYNIGPTERELNGIYLDSGCELFT